MNVYKKCEIAEQVGEVLMGGAMGLLLTNHVYPKCENNLEKIVITLGAGVGGWVAGRVWAKHFYKFCDVAFDTDHEEIIKHL